MLRLAWRSTCVRVSQTASTRTRTDDSGTGHIRIRDQSNRIKGHRYRALGCERCVEGSLRQLARAGHRPSDVLPRSVGLAVGGKLASQSALAAIQARRCTQERRPIREHTTEISDARLAKVAARHGASPPQIALAWLLAISPVTLAIPGTGSLTHLAEHIAAGSIALTDDDLAELAALGPSHATAG